MCHHCGKKGHTRPFCYELSRNHKGQLKHKNNGAYNHGNHSHTFFVPQQRSNLDGKKAEGSKSSKTILVWRPKPLGDAVDHGTFEKKRSHKTKFNNKSTSVAGPILLPNNIRTEEMLSKSWDLSNGITSDLKKLTQLGKETHEKLWTP